MHQQCTNSLRQTVILLIILLMTEYRNTIPEVHLLERGINYATPLPLGAGLNNLQHII